MSGVATAIGGAALVGGAVSLISANKSAGAAEDAARIQGDAANHASDLQNQQYQQQRADQEPWRQAGMSALGQMGDPSFQHDFSMSDFQADPGYDFRMQEGQKALERSAAARGGLMSGGTLKALTQYGQDYASNEYQNAYDRFTNNQSNRFNRLASLAGLGQTANGQLGQAGMNMANQVGENTMNSANARGAAGIAGANAYGAAASNISNLGSSGANTWMQYQMMNKFAPNPGGMGGYSAMGTGQALGNLGGSSGGYNPSAGTFDTANFGTLGG